MRRPTRTGRDSRLANDRQRRVYARQARRYDQSAERFERWMRVTGHRQWCCSHARGDTLEVAIGTGLNLPYYPPDVRLTGIDLTPEMLTVARRRARDLGHRVDLCEGDAQDLPFPDATFDTVVCTYALCAIPDDIRAIAEMSRVLRPTGRLVLLDHTVSTCAPLSWLQRAVEVVSARTAGEYWTRRPAALLPTFGFAVVAHDRLRAGVIERLVAERA